MNNKLSKKNRKLIRTALDKKFGEGMEALAICVRPRPKWIPRKIWILAYVPLFKKKYLKVVYRYMQ